MPLKIVTDPAAWRRAVELYSYSDMHAEAIAASIGLKYHTFYNRLREHGVPTRRAGYLGRPRDTPAATLPTPNQGPALPPVVGGEAGPVALPDLVARMSRLVARNMGALEASVAAGQAGDPERAARTIAIHARMLTGLDKLQANRPEETSADDSEPPARSLGELRDELRRHLERIRTEERSRAVSGEPDRAGNGEHAPPLADGLPGGPASA